MSLDVSLYIKTPVRKKGTGVYVREGGKNRELTVEEVRGKFPNAMVAEQEYETNRVFSSNITHNLGEMAEKAGVYKHLWRPEEIGITQAKDLINPLKKALKDMKNHPEYYKQFDAANRWGIYEDFIPWIEEYLEACEKYPDAEISVDR